MQDLPVKVREHGRQALQAGQRRVRGSVEVEEVGLQGPKIRDTQLPVQQRHGALEGPACNVVCSQLCATVQPPLGSGDALRRCDKRGRRADGRRGGRLGNDL